MPTLVAEVAEEAHTVVIHERDIGADDGFTVGELYDFNQNFLGDEPGSGTEECRSYKEWPQVHGFSDLGRR
jgi:hypothetical protein